MKPEQLALIQFALQFGLDAAIAFANGIKKGSSIDDVIAALEAAKTKTSQDYLDADKAVIGTATPLV